MKLNLVYTSLFCVIIGININKCNALQRTKKSSLRGEGLDEDRIRFNPTEENDVYLNQHYDSSETILNAQNMGEDSADISNKTDRNRQRALNIQTNSRWKDRSSDVVVIPYSISSVYTTDEQNSIKAAINDLSERSGVVKFITRTNQRAYIRVVSTIPNQCFSRIGKSRQGIYQNLNLGRNGCLEFGVIQHEFIHALGFGHEQSRPDRDSFVRIQLENIENRDKFQHNFFKATGTSVLGSPYEYGSVMHYGPTDFGSGNLQTIVALRSGGNAMGQRIRATDTDIKKLRLLYQCRTGPRDWSSYGRSQCTPDCKCWKSATGCGSNDDSCQGSLVCVNNQCVEDNGNSGGGSGGSGGGGCTDEEGWHDSYGESFDCDWYAQDDNCEKYGDNYENFGKTASEACCACGGGSTGERSYWEFKSSLDGRCMYNAGQYVFSWPCNGTPTQYWNWDSSQYIRSASDENICLVGSAGKSDVGTLLIVHECFANDDRFVWDLYTDYSIRPRNNKYVCLGPSKDWFHEDKAALQLNDCSESNYKQWSFTRVTASTRRHRLESGRSFSEECNDQPDGWYDIFGYNCEWYAEGNNCELYGMSHGNFGKTASQACCACGGGSSMVVFDSNFISNDPLNNDNSCWDERDWYDSVGDGCSWYEQGDNCEYYGMDFSYDGLTASDACCACGGGLVEAPEEMDWQSVSPGCSNSPSDWVDEYGENCEWYAESVNCSRFGDTIGLAGKTAQEACCACGGVNNPVVTSTTGSESASADSVDCKFQTGLKLLHETTKLFF